MPSGQRWQYGNLCATDRAFKDIYSNSWSYEVQWKANRQIIELTSFL
ncbi:hypothetical protein RVR34_17340 [Microcystis aeruginosa FBCC-A68]|nr:hypothetical protein [Microcystis aeruginosa]